ncbi:hypothetical protein O1M54_10375 [Streptomyces diastatochromogenes]|nr:hypothetical protein [Streptomyces diastatochromogenes]
MTALRYEVFVTPAISQSSGTLNLPDGEPMVWSPISTTLICGDRDAVLVDPPFTTDTTREVLAWLEKSGRPPDPVGRWLVGAQSGRPHMHGKALAVSPGSILGVMRRPRSACCRTPPVVQGQRGCDETGPLLPGRRRPGSGGPVRCAGAPASNGRL